MSRPLLKEDLELSKLRETEQELLQRQKEFAEIPRRLAMELKERESTMPPLAEIEERRRRNEHEQIVSRGEVANILRDQSRSFMLLVMKISDIG